MHHVFSLIVSSARKFASHKLALQSLAQSSAAGTLAIRGSIVGANFCVMLWLTLSLGLATFGALVLLWGAALVIGTVVSGGGPLILLRRLSSGNGMWIRQLAGLVVFFPATLCVLGWLFVQALWPDPRWAAVFAVAYCVNTLCCLASIMRALGSVQVSMVLRDAGPFSALGLAAVLAPDDNVLFLLWGAVGLMTLVALVAAGWCISNSARLGPPQPPSRVCWSWSLWGTSILGMILAQIDLIVGGAFMGTEALGLYALLRRIANVVALPVSVATWVSASPIAAAYDRGDDVGLRQASARGSQIAWYPALVICAVCICGLVVAAMLPSLTITAQIAVSFGILLSGALVQAFLASGFTVATLSDHATLSASARALTVLFYLSIAAVVGVTMTPVSNALCYTFAMCLGSGVVWLVLRRDLGVDTSACVLWRREVPAWRTS